MNGGCQERAMINGTLSVIPIHTIHLEEEGIEEGEGFETEDEEEQYRGEMSKVFGGGAEDSTMKKKTENRRNKAESLLLHASEKLASLRSRQLKVYEDVEEEEIEIIEDLDEESDGDEEMNESKSDDDDFEEVAERRSAKVDDTVTSYVAAQLEEEEPAEGGFQWNCVGRKSYRDPRHSLTTQHLENKLDDEEEEEEKEEVMIVGDLLVEGSELSRHDDDKGEEDVDPKATRGMRRRPSFGSLPSWLVKPFGSNGGGDDDDDGDDATHDNNDPDDLDKSAISSPPVITGVISKPAGRTCDHLEKTRQVAISLLQKLYASPSKSYASSQRTIDEDGHYDMLDPELQTRFDARHDVCYCKSCVGHRDEGGVEIRGEPPEKYSQPNGWCHLGLHVDGRTYDEGKDVWNKWNVAFHGFPHKHLASIVLNGVAFPNDRIKVGKRYVHVKKPLGHSKDRIALKNVFMSPSIHCAGCPIVYAIPVQINNFEGRKVWVQFALKLRVDPTCFTKRANNIDSRVWPSELPFDRHIPNDEIEWFTDARNCIVSTGLMVRLSYTNPRDDVHAKVSAWKATHKMVSNPLFHWFGKRRSKVGGDDPKNEREEEEEEGNDQNHVVDDVEGEDKTEFFGILREKATAQLEVVLSQLQEMYTISKTSNDDRGTFVKAMCQVVGPNVLEEVLEEVGKSNTQKRLGKSASEDFSSTLGTSTASPPQQHPRRRPSVSSFRLRTSPMLSSPPRSPPRRRYSREKRSAPLRTTIETDDQPMQKKTKRTRRIVKVSRRRATTL